MLSARSLISVAGTASRIIRTCVNYPTSRPSRTLLSSFLSRCALSTTPNNISSDGTSGSHSTTTTNIDEATSEPIVGDNTINSLSDIPSVILSSSSLSADSGISASAKSFLYKPMDRDERMAYLEETIKNNYDDLRGFPKKIDSATESRDTLLDKEVLTSNETKRLRIFKQDLSDLRGREKWLATKIAKLKTELSELKHPKEPVGAPVQVNALDSRFSSILSDTRNFLDTVLRHEVIVVNLSDSVDEAILKRSDLKEDRIYKFVKPITSLNAHNTLTIRNSFEWSSVFNAVEVYKLPASMRWPTMNCSKQEQLQFKFPEFLLRRMNSLHRHRVLATMNRLWYAPKGGHVRSPDIRVIWAGSPGSGKTMAVNEIILESILTLQKLGTQNKQTTNQFFFRNKKYLIRFFFDSKLQKVDFQLLYFNNVSGDLLSYLDIEYSRNKNSFVIYEMEETEVDPVFDMPFLLSTSCCELNSTIKTTWKSIKAFYLYDPLLFFEFEFFLKVCYAYGDHPMEDIGVLLDRFHPSGGVLRTIFDDDYEPPVSFVFKNNADHLSVFESLRNCTPFNIIPAVNSIVGVKFRIPFPIEENEKFLMIKKQASSHTFFPVEDAVFEFGHTRKNWSVAFLSDDIAIEMSRNIKLPEELINSISNILFQSQEIMNIYGGILKASIETLNLPDGFKMKSWEFFSCSDVSLRMSSKLIFPASRSAKIPVSSYSLISDSDKEGLISMMPDTTKIFTFEGQYLKTPFHKLSASYVYRSSVHNGPVIDALTADPASKRLFLFKSTLEDPYNHKVSITAFNEILAYLQIDTLESTINDIYFYMIVSAHQNYTSQHFFSFVLGPLYLNSCFLATYASEGGQKTLQRFIRCEGSEDEGFKGIKKINESYTSVLVEDLSSITEVEKSILKTIGGCCSDIENSFYEITLKKKLYEDFIFFLRVAKKLKPYICRAEFTASDVFKVKENSTQPKKTYSKKDKSKVSK